MFKQHLLQNLQREIFLLKQLSSYIEPRDLDFRPAEKMRSTMELMQYLSGVGATMLRWFIKNDLNPDEWVKIRQYRQTLTLENFKERLDEQMEQIVMYMGMISEEDLNTIEVQLPSKEKMILGSAIINAPIKWLAAYRMQLFTYLKMNGRNDISTSEAWTVMSDQPGV
jgi:hypothetical protein